MSENSLHQILLIICVVAIASLGAVAINKGEGSTALGATFVAIGTVAGVVVTLPFKNNPPE